jgi:hypothetical protein
LDWLEARAMMRLDGRILTSLYVLLQVSRS